MLSPSSSSCYFCHLSLGAVRVWVFRWESEGRRMAVGALQGGGDCDLQPYPFLVVHSRDQPRRKGWRKVMSLRGAAASASFAFIAVACVALLAGSQREMGVGVEHASLELMSQLPEDVKSCIRACVHVNMMVSTTSATGSSPHASCSSCTSLAPASFQGKHGAGGSKDTTGSRMMDDMWRSVHRSELCKAVADDEELHKKCNRGENWRSMKGAPLEAGEYKDGEAGSALMRKWADGDSPMRECIASAVELEQAKHCLNQGYVAKAGLKSAAKPVFVTGAVPAECKGLESQGGKLLRDCMEVEEGMRSAEKSLGVHQRAGGAGVEERERIMAVGEGEEDERANRLEAHAGYYDAHEAERREVRSEKEEAARRGVVKAREEREAKREERAAEERRAREAKEAREDSEEREEREQHKYVRQEEPPAPPITVHGVRGGAKKRSPRAKGGGKQEVQTPARSSGGRGGEGAGTEEGGKTPPPAGPAGEVDEGRGSEEKEEEGKGGKGTRVGRGGRGFEGRGDDVEVATATAIKEMADTVAGLERAVVKSSRDTVDAVRDAIGRVGGVSSSSGVKGGGSRSVDGGRQRVTVNPTITVSPIIQINVTSTSNHARGGDMNHRDKHYNHDRHFHNDQHYHTEPETSVEGAVVAVDEEKERMEEEREQRKEEEDWFKHQEEERKQEWAEAQAASKAMSKLGKEAKEARGERDDSRVAEAERRMREEEERYREEVADAMNKLSKATEKFKAARDDKVTKVEEEMKGEEEKYKKEAEERVEEEESEVKNEEAKVKEEEEVAGREKEEAQKEKEEVEDKLGKVAKELGGEKRADAADKKVAAAEKKMMGEEERYRKELAEAEAKAKEEAKHVKDEESHVVDEKRAAEREREVAEGEKRVAEEEKAFARDERERQERMEAARRKSRGSKEARSSGALVALLNRTLSHLEIRAELAEERAERAENKPVVIKVVRVGNPHVSEALLRMLNETVGMLKNQGAASSAVDVAAMADYAKRVKALEARMDRWGGGGGSSRGTGDEQVPSTGPYGVKGGKQEMPSVPVIVPAGGKFADPVIVRLESDAEFPARVFYTTDGSEPTDKSTSYGGAFVLSAGKATVSAVTIIAGSRGGESNVSRAVFDVAACTLADECCHWQLVLKRFEALQESLVRRNASEFAGDADAASEAKQRKDDYIDAEAGYRVMDSDIKGETLAEEYALRFVKVWGEASRIADQRLKGIVVQNDAEHSQLEDERRLILEILAMLADLKSGAKKDGDVKRAMLQIHEKINALSPGLVDRGALEGVTSSLAMIQEADDVKDMLMKMLNDLEAREKVLAEIEHKAVGALALNKAQLAHWEGEVVKNRRKIRNQVGDKIADKEKAALLSGSIKADNELGDAMHVASLRKGRSYSGELAAVDKLVEKTKGRLDQCLAVSP